MSTIPQLLAGLLAETAGGEPWHGASMDAVIRDLSPEHALAHPIAGAHSIAETVRHAAAWNRIVGARLAGGEPEVTEHMDWPPVDASDPKAWAAARADLDASVLDLEGALSRVPPERLTPGEKGFSLRPCRNAFGSLTHLTWHAGQISMLRRAQGLLPYADDAD